MDHVTADFPSSYITVGNTYTSPEQGNLFKETVDNLNIYNSSLFFQGLEKEVYHEYQFDFKDDNAKTNLEMTIQFIQIVFNSN